MDFYDQISGEYDVITGEDSRARRAREFALDLQRRETFASVLDVACGTGLHVVTLAEAGVRAVGADLSAQMLRRARTRAEQAGVELPLLQCPMQEIDRHVEGRFEAVLCLGNSLPHLTADGELDAAMAAFRAVLTEGGLLAIQLLNYQRILARQERIVHITRHGPLEYVRFYDFLDGLLRFNILRLAWSPDDTCDHEIHSTLLRPFTHAQLVEAAGRHGFGDVRSYAGMGFEPLDADEFDTLLLLARRG